MNLSLGMHDFFGFFSLTLFCDQKMQIQSQYNQQISNPGILQLFYARTSGLNLTSVTYDQKILQRSCIEDRKQDQKRYNQPLKISSQILKTVKISHNFFGKLSKFLQLQQRWEKQFTQFQYSIEKQSRQGQKKKSPIIQSKIKAKCTVMLKIQLASSRLRKEEETQVLSNKIKWRKTNMMLDKQARLQQDSNRKKQEADVMKLILQKSREYIKVVRRQNELEHAFKCFERRIKITTRRKDTK